MKKFRVLGIAAGFFIPSQAAMSDTLSGTDVSGYGGPLYKHMEFDDGPRNIYGLQGAMLFGRSLSLGLEAGASLGKEEGDFSDDDVEGTVDRDGQPFQPKVSFIGPYVAYAYAPDWIVHPIASISYSWAALNVNGENADFINILQPQIGIEINLAEIVRLAVSGGPRFVQGVAFRGKNDADYEGFTWAVNLHIGSF